MGTTVVTIIVSAFVAVLMVANNTVPPFIRVILAAGIAALMAFIYYLVAQIGIQLNAL
jgi:tetrahydromethanopterin S-methyltransferase subunit E